MNCEHSTTIIPYVNETNKTFSKDSTKDFIISKQLDFEHKSDLNANVAGLLENREQSAINSTASDKKGLWVPSITVVDINGARGEDGNQYSITAKNSTKPFKPSERVGFTRYFHNFPHYPEPKFPSTNGASNDTTISKSSEINQSFSRNSSNTKFDDEFTHSRVIFQDNEKRGYKIKEEEEGEEMNLEYALLQKAIKLQEKEVLLKNKEKMMEKWIRDNFPKRSINYSKYNNNDRNNIKNSRIPSPTTVYEVKNEPPYPFILPTRELFHSPNIDKKGGGLGDYKHSTAELYQQHDIAFNNNNEENLKKLEDYHKYLDSLTQQQGEEVYIAEVNKPNHNNYPIFSSYYDSKPSVDNIKNYFHKTHTSHIQEPFKHGDIDIKEKHKAAIWKDISHILTALVPIGILISALKPNVLRVDSNSTNMRPTIMPTMMPLRYRYIEQFVNSFKNENFEKDFTKSFKNKSACELYELCILATSDSDTKFDDGQKIIYRQLLRAVKSTPVQTLEMLGLKELFDNIKNNSCNKYQCNQYQINKS